jgi:6-phosphofructokinase 1
MSVAQARKAIDSAYVEATTNANCIGLVKLMGRHCGWIAALALVVAAAKL